jgi:hypothetical protein
MKPQNLKLDLTSEEIKKDYEWELEYNGKTISGSATVRSGEWDLEVGAWIWHPDQEGLTVEQEEEIISFVEANI